MLKKLYTAWLKRKEARLQESIDRTRHNEGFWSRSPEARPTESGLAHMEREQVEVRDKLQRLGSG